MGLDASFNKLPPTFAGQPPEEALFEFNRQLIEATAEYAAVFKPNIAFYEQSGPPGLIALKRTCDWLRTRYPDVPVLIDAKRGDLANTNEAYAEAFFNYYHCDALTVQPYMGGESLAPFLDRPDKGVFVLCRTSNPNSAELQALPVASAEPLFVRVALLAANEWNRNDNVGLVVGATYPKELGQVRHVAPNLPILIPGIGAQGGELDQVLKYGLDLNGAGVLINASRTIIYASSGPDFAQAAGREAARLTEAIQQSREQIIIKRRKQG